MDEKEATTDHGSRGPSRGTPQIGSRIAEAHERKRKLPFAVQVAVGIVVGAGAMYVALGPKSATTAATSNAPTSAPEELAAPGPKLVDVIGRSRAQVRASLGTALPGDASSPNADSFTFGPATLAVVYASGKAVALLVTTKSPQDAAATRRWVSVPPTGDVKLGSGQLSIKVSHAKANVVTFMEAEWATTLEKLIATENAKAETARLKTARKEYADTLDTAMLQDGQNATVRADGTVLRIQWILCNRATVYKLLDAQVAMKSIGFTRVVCSDGYGSNTTVNLNGK